jgi:hypothetical protein
MHSHCGWTLSLGVLWLVVGLGQAPLCAQPEAMPATVLSGEPTSVPVRPITDSTAPAAAVVEDFSHPVVSAQFVNGVPLTQGPAMPPGMSPAMPGDTWDWQLLPDGLMYKAYLAGAREARISNVWARDDNLGWLWDSTLGGHVGLIRYGTQDAFWPEGFQWDAEGAAFPRMDGDRNLISADFRFGLPLTARRGPWEGKFGYYHLCSHIADEYLLAHPDFSRLNFVRDELVLGVAFRPEPDLRLYAEAGWSFHTDGGAKPWEFQFGLDFSPSRPTGCHGAPFFAVNGHLRQEVDFGGSMTVQAGWQWRGQTGRLARVGMQYFNGKSEQFEFYKHSEELLGVGLWYDY